MTFAQQMAASPTARFFLTVMFFSFDLREVPKIAPWSELGVQVVRMCCSVVSAEKLSLVVHRVSQPPHDKES